MKKYVFILIIFFIKNSAFATHIVGGDITVKHLTGNNFEVTLHFYRDCLNGAISFDPTINLGVYDKTTNAQALLFTMSLNSSHVLTLGDSCFTPSNLCVEEGVYSTTINLPNNPHGYYISWQRCCRNNIIQNIIGPGNAGMVFYAELADPALRNSTPIFGSYPNAYMCAGQPNYQSFSATDVDGDSLSYSLLTPLNDNAPSSIPIPPPSSGPYGDVSWLSPYSAADMMGGTPVMSIDAHTGMIVSTPPLLGVYVFAVRVEEFRHGIKIGEIRRDIQYQVLTCTSNAPPAFSLPLSHTYTLIAGDSISIPIKANDPNSDWIGLSGTSELFSHSQSEPYNEFATDSAIGTVQSNIYVQTNCSNIRETPYHVTLKVRDYSCYGTHVIPFEIDIFVKDPLDGNMDSVISNVFTPNDDGENDFFMVKANVQECFDRFGIKIFGRWGELLFESNDFHFKWNGKNKSGKDMADGVYFYMIDARFKESSKNYNGFVHLFR
jgi:gliding motility-associated-like protein